MGVKGLLKTIREKCPHLVRTVRHASELGRCRIAIDTQIMLYKWVCGERQPGDTFLDDCRTTERCIDKLVEAMAAEGIWLIFVMDGVAPACKEDEQNKRRADAATSQERVSRNLSAAARRSGQDVAKLLTGEVAPADKAIATLVRAHGQTRGISRGLVNSARDMLVLRHSLGVLDFVQAPSEGERMCAWLCTTGRAEYCATSDSDAIALFAPRVLRGLNKSAHGPFEIIEPEQVMAYFGLDRSSFVDWCVLSGTDFHCGKIKDLGSARALKYMQDYGSIEVFLASDDGARYKLNAHGKNFGLARAQFHGSPYGQDQPDTFSPRRKPGDENITEGSPVETPTSGSVLALEDAAAS
jgi:5'-3' exonuclease